MTNRAAGVSRAIRAGRAAAKPASKRQEPLLPLVRSVTGTVKGPVLALSITSLIVGFAESGVLVLVAHAGVVMSGGGDAVDLKIGPLNASGWSLGAAIIVALVLALVRFVAQSINVWFTAGLVTSVIRRLRRETLAEYVASSWAVQADERRGHLQDLMTTFVMNISAALIACASALSAALTFGFLVAAALAVDPLAAIGVAATVSVLFAALRPLSMAARSYSRRRAMAGLGYANSINELAESSQDLRVFGVQEAAQARVRTQADDFERLFHRTRVLQGLVPATYQGVAMLLVVGGLGALHWSGAREIASLSALVLIFVRAAAYGQQMQVQLQQINATSPYIELLRTARERFQAGLTEPGHLPLGRVEVLELEDVDFGYKEGQLVLEAASLRIERGEVIGVVGPSGAGKSTLVQILLRLRPPTTGTYRVNGVPASDYSTASWASHFAFVPQDPHLMAVSASENISFLRPDIDHEQVEVAARQAHIHEEILDMASGYDTWVGDDGRNLSGGQRQRLAIARALAGQPDVIILDEPTSALDMRSEDLIQKTLAELKGDVTMIVIAHRLSTLANCDRILVLDEGRVQAFDTPDRLLETNDFYRQSVALSRLV